jgi:dTDP-4-dehydrorhamnose 3,5-epimerase-like enzyme
MKLHSGKTDARFTKQIIVHNPKGDVQKFLPKPKENSFSYKEIYFSSVLPNEQKKWKRNKRQMQNITVVHGRVAIICINARDAEYIYEEFLLDTSSNHGILEIPAGTIYGFFTGPSNAVIANALEDFYQASDAIVVTEEFDLTPTRL